MKRNKNGSRLRSFFCLAMELIDLHVFCSGKDFRSILLLTFLKRKRHEHNAIWVNKTNGIIIMCNHVKL